MLKWRLKEELKKYGLKWQLFRLNLKLFKEEHLFILLVLGVLIYWVDNIFVRILLALFFLYNLYNSVKHTFLS